ncbi:hypothetical protein [Mesorhizobium australicum]|uniref:hypothetical protein n=1 Tax=Mesorhizobium australicum TaxID=536018 RepID=UPI00111BD942|nr:hypothetical protein [Mesorhizobium australicum]
MKFFIVIELVACQGYVGETRGGLHGEKVMMSRLLMITAALALGAGGGATAQNLGNGSVAPAGAGAVANGGSAQLFAVINSNGTIVRDKGAVSASNPQTGGYEVIFARNVRQCVYTVTIGIGDANTPPAGLTSVASRAGNVNGVWIQTYNTDGLRSDLPFHLWVNC